jgi:photosystem II stability/assembly factor-like uncharacterized protein
MISPHDDFFGICQGSGGQAWAVGKNGIILHTKDGGRNWEKQASGVVEPLSAVSFANNQVGFVVGGGGIILATRDGGLSWRMQSSGIKDYLLGVHALDENRAYVVGPFGTFLATADGGTTWKKSGFSWEKLIPRILEEVGSKIEPNLNAVHFVTQEIGWVVGEFGLILHTRDGGRTWTSQRGGGKLPQLCAVIFRDEHQGWAAGQQGTLIWTKDGGQQWNPSKIGIDRDLYAVALEGKHMVTVGDHVSLTTENGGSTWTAKDFAENAVLTGVALMSNEATVVGQGGVIRRVD